ncbi:hypothetical protein L218DRAFT_958378 [Marasmius fiardii PR-910]|nr:hypothetical protein L218DRAFT_958378 [Marasmius fiardii PR-910]
MAQRTVRFSRESTTASTVPDNQPKDYEINPKIDGIHDILQFRSTPKLTFDVSKDPTTIHLLTKELTEDERREPATIPAVSYVKLVSKYLPWEIEILPSSPDDKNAFVSVGDVLEGLYCALRIPVTDREFQGCGNQEDVKAAFKERCRVVADEQGESEADFERRAGIKRVDFLQGNLRFCGLTELKPRARHLKFSVRKP